MLVREFYNSEIKERFFDYKLGYVSGQSVGVYRRLFKLISDDENWYEMDFCDFDYETLINVLSSKLSRSRASRSTQLSQLREYVAWCIANNIKKNNDNPIQQINVDDIDVGVQIRKQFIKDPEHLKSILDNVLQSEKEDIAFDIMTRMSCCLLYEGFIEREVIELTNDNVDLDNSVITYNEKKVIISKELKEMIKKAVELTETQRVIGHNVISLKLEESDYLLRRISRKDISDNRLAYLREMLSVLKKRYKINNYEVVSLSPQRLWLSGIYYRLYLKEQSQVLVDDDFKYDTENITDKYLYSNKIRQNQREYNEWKVAFDIR